MLLEKLKIEWFLDQFQRLVELLVGIFKDFYDTSEGSLGLEAALVRRMMTSTAEGTSGYEQLRPARIHTLKAAVARGIALK